MIKTLHVPIGALASVGFDPSQQLFLTMVLSFRKTKTGCRMSHKAIAEHLNLHTRTIIRMIGALEKDGWLEVKKMKRAGTNENESNLYTPSAKLLSLLGSDSKSLGSDKTVSLGSDKMIQNTLLTEEKSIAIENEVGTFSVPTHLKVEYEKYKSAFNESYAQTMIQRMMNQTKTQSV